jgi:hypothetical protein
MTPEQQKKYDEIVAEFRDPPLTEKELAHVKSYCEGSGFLVLRNTAHSNECERRLEEAKTAIREYLDLMEEIHKSPPPPHTDYWHQSIYMARAKLRAVIEGAKDGNTPATD